MKKKEAIFIGGILVIAAVFWLVLNWFRQGEYSTVRITVDGSEYGTYSLAEDQVISIGNTNVCGIRNGEAKMIEADCPDHLCMKQKAIGSAGGTIVCLPNRVVIEGVGEYGSESSSSDIDTVV